MGGDQLQIDMPDRPVSGALGMSQRKWTGALREYNFRRSICYTTWSRRVYNVVPIEDPFRDSEEQVATVEARFEHAPDTWDGSGEWRWTAAPGPECPYTADMLVRAAQAATGYAGYMASRDAAGHV